jgi:hypothetical protein
MSFIVLWVRYTLGLSFFLLIFFQVFLLDHRNRSRVLCKERTIAGKFLIAFFMVCPPTGRRAHHLVSVQQYSQSS